MKRNEKIDLIKCIAIFLVVCGHSIQYGSGEAVLKNGVFFLNTFFEFIYSFHMPLFMLITGYLFHFSLKKYKTWEIIKSRISMLLVPICVWSLIPFSIKLIDNWEIGIFKMIKLYISTAVRELWFLWAVFYCSLIVLVINRYMKDNIIIYILGFVTTFLITDERNFSLYKYMYPFFVLGYFYGKHGKRMKEWWQQVKNRKVLILFLLSMYILLFAFYDYDSYIYTSGYSVLGKDVLKQIGIDMYRLIIGFVGSLVVIIFVDNIYSLIKGKKTAGIMTYIGRNSMGIYVISGAIFTYILPEITTNILDINYLVVLLESVLIIGISLIINSGLKKNKIISGLFLGGRS